MRRERRVSHVKLIYDAKRGVMVPREGMGDGEPACAARICYVDDSRTSSYVTLKILRQYGYEVDAFHSAEEALDALMERDYDLLLTDLVLSHGEGMNGDGLVRVLRRCGLAEKARMPAVVITGDRDEGVVERLHQVGADEVLVKPFKGKELNQVLRRLLARQEPPPVLQQPVGRAEEIAQHRREGPAEPVDEVPSTAETAAHEPVEPSEVVTQVIDGFDDFERPSIFSGLGDPLKARRLAAPGPSSPAFSEPATEPPFEPPGRSPEPPPTGEGSAARDMPPPSEPVPEPPPPKAAPPPPRREVSPSPPGSDPLSEESGLQEDSLLSLLDDFESRPAQEDSLPARPRRAMAIPLLLLLALLLSAIGYGAWTWWQGREPEVRLTEVIAGPIYDVIHAAGRVVSDRFVDVTSHDPGQLVEVLVKEGDRVEGGQLLARMDDQEARMRVKRMEATLISLEEEVARAEKIRERLRKAYQVGAVSRQSLDDAEADWTTASARLSVAQEELAAARLALERTRIKAPFAGVVTEVKAHAGQWIAPPQPILHLVDESRKVVRLRVDAADSGRLAPGQTVVLSSEAFPDRRWREKVIRIAPSSNANVVEVEVSLGRNAPPLRLGQPVSGEIRIHGRDRAVKLPLEALVERDGRSMVMLVRDGRIRYQPVEVGIEDFTHVEVRSGLQPGDRVVLPQGRLLPEGQAVRVVGLDG